MKGLVRITCCLMWILCLARKTICVLKDVLIGFAIGWLNFWWEFFENHLAPRIHFNGLVGLSEVIQHARCCQECVISSLILACTGAASWKRFFYLSGFGLSLSRYKLCYSLRLCRYNFSMLIRNTVNTSELFALLTLQRVERHHTS